MSINLDHHAEFVIYDIKNWSSINLFVLCYYANIDWVFGCDPN
jgi:hypothetical protein